jgi:hypothetical protein
MAHKGVKIAEDFHETSRWSYGLCHNFPCKPTRH